MQCFNHASTSAVGICRACGRGVCAACARDNPHGIVCSDRCQEFVDIQLEMVERAKRVYAIGGNKQRFPGMAIIFILFGALMLAIALFSAHSYPLDWLAPGAFGLIFLIGAWIIWRRMKYTGLNM